jgi:hypothetical protein
MKYRNGPTAEPLFVDNVKRFTDAERREFLDAIDPDLVRVTQWEKDFLSFTKRQTTFTPRQRASIGRMIKAYGAKVNWSRRAEFRFKEDERLEAAAGNLLFACKMALAAFKEHKLGLAGQELLENAIAAAEGRKS